MFTLETIVQSLASGLLMGLLYGLIAVGLALIFGLMDVVNFSHGEFLMLAMYVALGFAVFAGLDPLLSAPLVAAAWFGVCSFSAGGLSWHWGVAWGQRGAKAHPGGRRRGSGGRPVMGVRRAPAGRVPGREAMRARV